MAAFPDAEEKGAWGNRAAPAGVLSDHGGAGTSRDTSEDTTAAGDGWDRPEMLRRFRLDGAAVARAVHWVAARLGDPDAESERPPRPVFVGAVEPLPDEARHWATSRPRWSITLGGATYGLLLAFDNGRARSLAPHRPDDAGDRDDTAPVLDPSTRANWHYCDARAVAHMRCALAGRTLRSDAQMRHAGDLLVRAFAAECGAAAHHALFWNGDLFARAILKILFGDDGDIEPDARVDGFCQCCWDSPRDATDGDPRQGTEADRESPAQRAHTEDGPSPPKARTEATAIGDRHEPPASVSPSRSDSCRAADACGSPERWAEGAAALIQPFKGKRQRKRERNRRARAARRAAKARLAKGTAGVPTIGISNEKKEEKEEEEPDLHHDVDRDGENADSTHPDFLVVASSDGRDGAFTGPHPFGALPSLPIPRVPLARNGETLFGVARCMGAAPTDSWGSASADGTDTGSGCEYVRPAMRRHVDWVDERALHMRSSTLIVQTTGPNLWTDPHESEARDSASTCVLF